VTAPVILRARLDSAAAITLAGMLRDLQGTDVVIDASRVELLGAKAMQTLLLAAASWRAAGLGFTVTNVSAMATRHLSDLGLSDMRLIEGAAP
jgi:chemotaxis protein CheX